MPQYRASKRAHCKRYIRLHVLGGKLEPETVASITGKQGDPALLVGFYNLPDGARIMGWGKWGGWGGVSGVG